MATVETLAYQIPSRRELEVIADKQHSHNYEEGLKNLDFSVRLSSQLLNPFIQIETFILLTCTMDLFVG